MVFYKLCDFKGEDEAWAMLGELIAPLAEIAADDKVKAAIAGKSDKISAAKQIIASHKEAATRILALLSKQDYEAFKKEITPAAILVGVITVLNDKELIDLFQSQGQMTDEN